MHNCSSIYIVKYTSRSLILNSKDSPGVHSALVTLTDSRYAVYMFTINWPSYLDPSNPEYILFLF